ncbi:MAG: lipoyl(octanoyl) transferase LipB [Gemmatimonadetes bacterium]|nr:lipoyl(octanoyl) transferase LipB [Gemmatimonadota bacterium]
MPEERRPALEVRRLGRVPYDEALDLQTELVARRRSQEVPDQLLLLEHPHVITLGTSSLDSNVLLSEEELERKGIHLYEAGRGGDVTYHGPGQLVGYPILALGPNRRDLHRYLRDLEEVLILTLRRFGIQATREEGLTGVWVPEGKLGAIGVRVSSGWITSHGFALNVDTDLDFFSAIVPCGIQDRPVTSMTKVLGRRITVDEVLDPLSKSFESVFSLAHVVV